MITNAILHENSETRIPRYRDSREILKKTTELMRSIGQLG